VQGGERMVAGKVGRPKGCKPSRSFRLTEKEHELVKAYIQTLRINAKIEKYKEKLKGEIK